MEGKEGKLLLFGCSQNKEVKGTIILLQVKAGGMTLPLVENLSNMGWVTFLISFPSHLYLIQT